MSTLAEQACKPCEGGVKPLNRNDAHIMLAQLNGWNLGDDNKTIQQDFHFKNYYQKYIQKFLTNYFPNLLGYSRILRILKSVFVPGTYGLSA